MKLSFEHYTRMIALSGILVEYVVIFTSIMYLLNVADLELTEINSAFKYLGGFML